jgi:hypothetical protein
VTAVTTVTAVAADHERTAPRSRSRRGRPSTRVATLALLIAGLGAGGFGCRIERRPVEPTREVAGANTPSDGPTRPTAPIPTRVTITADSAYDQLVETVCFDGPAPSAIAAPKPAPAALLSANAPGGHSWRGVARIDTRALPADACVELVLDVAALEATHGGNKVGRRGRMLVADPSTWLWVPESLRERGPIELHFELDPGHAVLGPWPARDATNDEESAAHRSVHDVDPATVAWRAHAVLGPLSIRTVDAAHTRFEIAVLDGTRAATDAGVERWIGTAATTVAQLFDGRFPVPRVAVIVVPVSSYSTDPVVFGHVTRGAGASVMLLLGDVADDASLPGEWVAIHEFLHLGTPFVAAKDAWFYEGFVTYYTYVLIARAGLFRDDEGRRDDDVQVFEGLDALRSGFARARRWASRTPLAEASAKMHATGDYFHVYWGGAAVAFLADLELRRRFHGEHTLDDVMRGWLASRGAPNDAVQADALVEMADGWIASWGSTPFLETLAAEHLAAKEIPDLDEAFSALGADPNTKPVTLDATPDAGVVALREALFLARSPRSAAEPRASTNTERSTATSP